MSRYITISFNIILISLLYSCSSTPLVVPKELSRMENVQNPVDIEVNWRNFVGWGSEFYYSFSCPTAFNGDLYISSYSGVLYKIEPSNGDVLGRYSLQEKIASKISLENNRLYVGSLEGNLFVVPIDIFDNEDLSSEVLKIFLHRSIYTQPLLTNDSVIVHLSDDQVISLNKSSLISQWRFFDGQASSSSLYFLGNSSPIDLEHGILTGTSDSRVVLLNRENGRIVWDYSLANSLSILSGSERQQFNYQVGETQTISRSRSEINLIHDVDSSILVDGNYVYVSNAQNNLVSFRRNNLEPIWQRSIGSTFSLSYDSRNLYIVDQSGYIYALNKLTGQTIWVNDDYEQRSVTAPTVLQLENQEYLIVSDYDGYIHIIDILDGRTIARKRISNVELYACQEYSNSALFVDRHGFLYSISIE